MCASSRRQDTHACRVCLVSHAARRGVCASFWCALPPSARAPAALVTQARTQPLGRLLSCPPAARTQPFGRLLTGGSSVRRVFWPCPDVGSHGLHHLWQGGIMQVLCTALAPLGKPRMLQVRPIALAWQARDQAGPCSTPRQGGSMQAPTAMCHSSDAHAWDRPYPLWPPDGTGREEGRSVGMSLI